MSRRALFSGGAAWWIGAAAAAALHGSTVMAMMALGGRAAETDAPPGIVVELPPAIVAEKPLEAAPDKQVQEQAARPAPPRRQEFAMVAPPAPAGDFAPKPLEQPREEAKPAENAPAADATAPQAAKAASGAERASYEQRLRAHLERNKRYPRAARSHGQEGVALVRFSMDRQGRVLSSRLVRSAGYPLLDEEVLALVQRAQPLPAPPPDIAGATLSLTVPIEFEMR